VKGEGTIERDDDGRELNLDNKASRQAVHGGGRYGMMKSGITG